MSWPPQEGFPNSDRSSGMDHRLEEARGYYAEEHSEVSVIILHMSELLSSFVREDAPEKRAEWSRALAEVRNDMVIHPAHEELRFITDFSVMLEEGLQCIADKCAKLQQAAAAAAAQQQLNTHNRVAAGAERQLKRQHNDIKIQVVACDLCQDAIPRLRYYSHLRQEHPKEFEKIAKFRCNYCKSAIFLKEPAFKAHLEVCDKRLEQERLRARFPPPHQLICRMCNLNCATIKELAVHSELAHPHLQILTCTGCAQLYRQPEQLVEHWRMASSVVTASYSALASYE